MNKHRGSRVAISSSSVAVLVPAVTSLASADYTPGADPSLGSEPAVEKDASAYAVEYKVDVVVARDRLALQDIVGEIGAGMAAAEPATYAGRWIQHTPEFVVHFAFTAGGPDMFRKYVAETPIAAVTEVASARYSLKELEARREALSKLRSSVEFSVSIDEPANRVIVRTDDAMAFIRDVYLAGGTTEDILFASFEQSRPATNVYAGPSLSTCTAGFSVHDASPSRDGVLTAAHCGNTQWWQPTGQPLLFVAQNYSNGPNDEQWHVADGWTATYKNWALESATDYRLITSKTTWQSQSVGDYVCHYGKHSGYGCGNITEKYSGICGGASDQFGIRVHNSGGADLSDGGDSGGPWYSGQTARGIMSCQVGEDINPDPDIFDALDGSYVAANFVENGLGVTIKLAP